MQVRVHHRAALRTYHSLPLVKLVLVSFEPQLRPEHVVPHRFNEHDRQVLLHLRDLEK